MPDRREGARCARDAPTRRWRPVAMVDERDATTIQPEDRIKARSAKHKRTQIAINKGAV